MIRNRICDIAGECILILLLIVFVFVAVNGLFFTCSVEIFYSPDNNEHVLFEADRPLLTGAATLVCFALTWLLLRCRITKRTVRLAILCMVIAAVTLSTWWISQAKAVPYADSKTVLDAVLAMVNGNAKALAQTDYFIKYPYQLGFAFYAEQLANIFGADALNTALSVGNIVCLLAIELALVAITRRLFDHDRTVLLCALMLMFCVQPAFLCTFLYGLFPGLAFALWGCYFVIRFMQEEKLLLLIPAAVLIACAIVLKQNHKVLLVANCIILVIYTLRKKRAVVFAGILGMLLLSMLLPKSVQRHYENKADTTFGKGTPFTAWLMTGLSESSFCSGWFNSYPITIMPEHNYDPDAASIQIRADVLDRVSYFASRPRYLLAFTYHKLTSHWNEPLYQCIWSSAAGNHSGTLSPFADSVSYGKANSAIKAYCNVFDQFIYSGFVIALFILLSKDRRTEGHLVLLLTILGIFLYHALFEAKAQYALPPFLMMIPYAAFGTEQILSKVPAGRHPHG